MSDIRIEILKEIQRSQNRNGWAPSFREIMEEVGLFTTSAVAYHIRRLAKDGLIERQERRARCLRVTEKGLEAIAFSILKAGRLQQTENEHCPFCDEEMMLQYDKGIFFFFCVEHGTFYDYPLNFRAETGEQL